LWCLWITCGQHAEAPFNLSTFLQCIWHYHYDHSLDESRCGGVARGEPSTRAYYV
jgi:hypothetical protein